MISNYSKDFNFFFFLFLFSIIFYTTTNLVTLADPILVQHGWRQSHNALNAFYIIENGFSLNYETPNFGEPWSVPHEFPIYHWCVSILTIIFEMPVTYMGRLVSLIFGLLTCIPIYYSLIKLNISRNIIFLCLTLFLSAPSYIYWSGTFMIETTALFFTCCFIFLTIKIIKNEHNLVTFLFLTLFLSLALLQKITTAFPAMLVSSLILLIYLFKTNSFKSNYKLVLKIILSFAIANLASLSWFVYADHLKSMNPLMNGLTLENSIHWYFGTLGDKFSSQLWLGTIFEGTIIPGSGIFIGFLSFTYLIFKNKNKNLQFIIYSLLLFFLVPFLVHTRVHINHKYYQVANLVFWSIISGISIDFYFKKYLKIKDFYYYAILIFVLIVNYAFFFHKYFFHPKSQMGNQQERTMVLGKYLQNNTEKNYPIVIFGYGGSSTLTFYSHRKALSVNGEGQGIKVIKEPFKFFTSLPKTYIFCPALDSKGNKIKGYTDAEAKKLLKEKYTNHKSEEFLDCEIIYIEPPS